VSIVISTTLSDQTTYCIYDCWATNSKYHV